MIFQLFETFVCTFFLDVFMFVDCDFITLNLNSVNLKVRSCEYSLMPDDANRIAA